MWWVTRGSSVPAAVEVRGGVASCSCRFRRSSFLSLMRPGFDSKLRRPWSRSSFKIVSAI
eukprot:8100229-Heterocapsa_arctica.AAC.1